MGGAEVSYPAEQVKRPVPGGDQGVVTEHDGRCPVGRLGELGEHDPRHAGLHTIQWTMFLFTALHVPSRPPR